MTPEHERDPRSFPDGHTVRRLANGLEIVRRQKHEPLTTAVPRERLVELTGKRMGSKFLPGWPPSRVVEWLEAFLLANEWTVEPGVARSEDVRLNEPVGLVRGERVHTIRVMRNNGRYVHAFPVEDEP